MVAHYDDGTRLYIVDYRFVGKIQEVDQLNGCFTRGNHHSSTMKPQLKNAHFD